MKKILYLVCILSFLYFPMIANSQVSISAGPKDSDVLISDSYRRVSTTQAAIRVTYSDYYKVESSLVEKLEGRKFSEDDISVALFLAGKGKVNPDVILVYREKGLSWLDITIKLGFGVDIFYIPIPANVHIGPPYGKAYGYWRKHGVKSKVKIVFDDWDIRNLVQLRLVCDYYGYKPEDVIKWREEGKKFDAIIFEGHEKKHKPADVGKSIEEPKGIKKFPERGDKIHGKGKSK